jgi:hypothetical protein
VYDITYLSAQEWDPLTDHRETKTLGGKSMTQVRDTQNETKNNKKIDASLASPAGSGKQNQEREKL